jgi:GNAT superfamily N-acetyltransferase
MNSNPTQQALLAFLRCDRMRNIVPLKMLAAHGAAIQSYFQRQDSEAGALLLFPTSLFAYDRQTYGERDLVVLLVADTPAIAQTLLAQLPRNQKLVFKLINEETRGIVAQHFPLTRARAFISYTTDKEIALTNQPQVRMTQQVDERLYAAYAAHGHTSAMIADYFADGEAWAFTLYQGELPVAACFTYSNFEEIHEVGGVLSLPSERRKGYAKLVVESALYALRQRGRQPRYQVDEANLPSIKLAESLGLRPFVTVTHWLNTA